ncbi:MAG: hypothetical protein ACE5KS_10595, partial [Woeseiaceae bacterium]
MMFLQIGGKAAAQSDTSGPPSRPLFSSDSILAISIDGPLTTIMRKRDESEQFPATLQYTDSDGTGYTLDIQLRARGKYRRKRDVCNFVPLRVNFKKKQVQGTAFAGQDKIKLVTDCQSSSKRYQQLLLKEYLTYRLFNLMTDRSFRARLLRVTYVDSDRKGKTRESYAFFIEEKEHIADRLGIKLLDLPGTKYSALDAAHANLVNVYEYFIGNTDYSLVAGPKDASCCHNAVLYQKGGAPIITIPYDFDHAGMVDAPHASPNPKFRIRDVKQRLYRGRCANNGHLDSTLQLFL